MFYTSDGFTQDNNGKEIENCQILGWANGIDAMGAYKNFQPEHEYLSEYDFNSTVAIEVLEEIVIK